MKSNVLGILSLHPKLFFHVFYRPNKFIKKPVELTPPDFHITHVRMCLERSARRFRKYYQIHEDFQPEKLLKKELSYFPCGRKTWLYIAIRLLNPKKVVETGVCFGFSTAQILQALNDNENGILYSVDTPNIAYDSGLYWDEKYLPKGTESGFVIPRGLRKRWEFIQGYSEEVLPGLLKRIGPIDFFLHDSKHTYETMMFEYKSAWEYLSEGGILCSDDVHTNRAFVDFCQQVGINGTVVHEYGILIKNVK